MLVNAEQSAKEDIINKKNKGKIDIKLPQESKTLGIWSAAID